MENNRKEKELRIRAEIIRIEKPYNCSKSLIIAMAVEQTVNELINGKCNFTYVTRNGERRQVRGTLTNYRENFGKDYTPNPQNRFVPYFDLNTSKWQVFHVSSIIPAQSSKQILNA